MRLLFFCFLFTAALVKRGVDCVEIFAAQVVLSDSQGIGKTVNMKYYYQFSAMSTVLLYTVTKGKEWSSTLNKHHCSHSSS